MCGVAKKIALKNEMFKQEILSLKYFLFPIDLKGYFEISRALHGRLIKRFRQDIS